VIGGTAEVDRHTLNRAKDDARAFEGKAEFEFWDNHSMAELRKGVAALPARTVILFGRMFRDRVGQAVISTDVARLIARWANVPVYVMTDAALGTGAVGGSVVSIEAIGQRAGELAYLVLTGTPPESLRLENSGRVPTFDWRALQRWGINESRLPEGSVVRFMPVAFWQLYKWYIVAVLAIIAIQTAVIANLVLHRRQRRKAESDLRASEENLRRLVETTAAVPWQADAHDWQFTYVGPQAVKLLGYPLQDWYQKDFWISHLHPDDKKFATTNRSVNSARTVDFAFDYRLIASTGKTIWVHDIVHCEQGNGQPAQLRGFMLDITDRKEMEHWLRESEEGLSLATTAANLAVWVWDVVRDEIWLTHQGRILFEWEPSETINFERFIGQLVPEDREPVRQAVHRSLTQDIDYSVEYRVLAPDRSVRWIASSGAVEFGMDGKPLRMRGVAMDITPRKQAEAELQHNRQELAHITRVSTMGELAASLAHELNQPLTAILSNAQAAQRFLSSERPNVGEVREILSDIVQDNNRAGEVIRRMRALVKKEQLQFNSLDLKRIIEEMLPLVHSDAILRNVHVSLDLSADLPCVHGDKIQLQQVLLNLLLNAFDSMKNCPFEDKTVLIRAATHGAGMIEVSVYDRGTGLTADKLDKLFQPFYTTKPDGLGMGLSISRSIIQAHGGRLWVENNPDRGATFYFVLPVAEEGRGARVEDRGSGEEGRGRRVEGRASS
jgi:PAS domain S-box-containing protein